MNRSEELRQAVTDGSNKTITKISATSNNIKQ